MDRTQSPGKQFENLIKFQLMRYTRKRKLLCKNGLYLELRPNGEVCGTKDANSPYILLQILSIGADMFALWGTAARKYLAVDEDGKLITKDREGRECVFLESFTPDYFNVYESYPSVYNDSPKCISLSNDGLSDTVDYNGRPSANEQFIWRIVGLEEFKAVIY